MCWLEIKNYVYYEIIDYLRLCQKTINSQEHHTMYQVKKVCTLDEIIV